MTSRKQSAKAKQRAEFMATRGSADDLFERSQARMASLENQREDRYRQKSCQSKNRYSTKQKAEDTMLTCAAHGTSGLTCYYCDFCNGWHLTSHPFQQ